MFVRKTKFTINFNDQSIRRAFTSGFAAGISLSILLVVLVSIVGNG